MMMTKTMMIVEELVRSGQILAIFLKQSQCDLLTDWMKCKKDSNYGYEWQR